MGSTSLHLFVELAFRAIVHINGDGPLGNPGGFIVGADVDGSAISGNHIAVGIVLIGGVFSSCNL